MARWIKLNLEEASNFNMVITEVLKDALPNLKLEAGRDIRDYLIWSVLGDFTYIRTALFDLKNKNRINNENDIEISMWDNAIKENNWQTVYDIPRQEIIL